MSSCLGYAVKAAGKSLTPFTFERRDLREKDVHITILYCGVCGSDLHRVEDDWHNTIYPVVPGHEIVGRVSEIGSAVTKFQKDDLVGVGVIIDSCQECKACKNGAENYCEQKPTSTYNTKDRITGAPNYGGYSQSIVVTEKFVFNIPDSLNPASVAPLLCAGTTAYSVLKHWQAGKGKKVGIVGLGGIGHIAIKVAKAMGADVVAITRSSEKNEEALRLGAITTILSTDPTDMKKHNATFDLIISSIPTSHDINPYLELLATDGTLVLPGLFGSLESSVDGRILGSRRRSISSSYIGGLHEVQEMLAFCAANHITADIELINIQEINEALERLKKSDVKYRFVIDMASLK